MGLKFHNTLTRGVEEFAPLTPPHVGLYCCGPTVYDFGHIGNFRTFVFSDVVRRYLEFLGAQVNVADAEARMLYERRERKWNLSFVSFEAPVVEGDAPKAEGAANAATGES